MKLASVAVVMALLMPAGCTGKDDAAPGKPETEARGLETVTIPARKPPRIKLLDAGPAATEVMRLHPAAGQRETLEMTMGMEMKLRSGAKAMPSVALPTNRITFVVEVERVEADSIVVRHAVEAYEVEPRPGTPATLVEQVRSSVAPLEQYRAVMRMDPRGAVLGGEAEIPRDLPASVHQAMQQMSESLGQVAVPLPEEAVGPGARWRTTQDLEQGGMKLRQRGEYRLTSREGDRATLEVSLEQTLLDPEIEPPGMLGAKARVSRFTSSGQGTIELDLGHLAPTRFDMSVELSMAMDVTAMGQSQSLDMDTTISLAMRRGDSPSP